jgi:hypothetical protein
MTITPALLRVDTKGRPCGQSHIAPAKTCRKTGGKAVAVGLTAGVVGTALLYKGSRNAILTSPKTVQRVAQRGVTEVVHRATARKPSMRITRGAFEQIRPLSKTESLGRAARSANVKAEKAMRKAAQAEIERGMAVGQAMYAAGKAGRASLRSGMRSHRLTVEKLRRRYEPGYRKPRRDSLIQYYAPAQLQPPARRDTEDGKKYSKKVRNPKTGRTRIVRYGAKGYKIAPGTDKGDRYCARSFGDMKSHGKDCSGKDRNTPLCLSRAKWKCSGKVSRRDGGVMPGKFSAFRHTPLIWVV